MLNLLSGRITPEIKVAGPHHQDTNHFWGCRPSLWQRVLFNNDDGVGGDGVTREAFSLFWDMVVGTPFISHGGDIHTSLQSSHARMQRYGKYLGGFWPLL